MQNVLCTDNSNLRAAVSGKFHVSIEANILFIGNLSEEREEKTKCIISEDPSSTISGTFLSLHPTSLSLSPTYPAFPLQLPSFQWGHGKRKVLGKLPGTKKRTRAGQLNMLYLNLRVWMVTKEGCTFPKVNEAMTKIGQGQ